ncbi:hypothetical protein ACFY05_32345 [Microtetraspora fusca]|uniref:Uncharacterized protein n=1 Tax=Microtetraspora fusca TaxID=1997 RepID=A0ABW6VDX6_MICFU
MDIIRRRHRIDLVGRILVLPFIAAAVIIGGFLFLAGCYIVAGLIHYLIYGGIHG